MSKTTPLSSIGGRPRSQAPRSPEGGAGGLAQQATVSERYSNFEGYAVRHWGRGAKQVWYPVFDYGVKVSRAINKRLVNFAGKLYKASIDSPLQLVVPECSIKQKKQAATKPPAFSGTCK